MPKPRHKSVEDEEARKAAAFDSQMEAVFATINSEAKQCRGCNVPVKVQKPRVNNLKQLFYISCPACGITLTDKKKSKAIELWNRVMQ